ncbi:cytochrome P450 3A14-like isoform X2 [Haemaphysalis longicornis]
MIASGVLLTVAVVLAVILLRWRRKHFSYFESIGIPGPEPNLIWGNLREYHREDRFKVLGKWLRKYGDVFGFYNGDVPFLVVNDLDFLEYVFVRNFQNFIDRGLTMMTDQMHPLLNKSILHVRGSEWTNIRNAVTQGLSAAKLKLMMPEFERSADLFLKRLSEVAGKEVNSYDEYQKLSMDYTARGAFGVDTIFQHEPDHVLLTTAKKVLDGVMTGPSHMIAQSTSTLGVLMKPFYSFLAFFGSFTFAALAKETLKVVEMRRKNPSLRRPDILQNLIDATTASDKKCQSSSAEGSSKGRSLSNEEVFMTANSLFIAGFDTTATTLTYVTFCIAKHLDVQTKLRQEIREILTENQADLDYDTTMKKLPYLKQVVKESLRLFPPALIFSTRRAKADFEYNGVQYKSGTCVMAPTYQVHTDNRYWPDAQMFDPNRFSAENEGAVQKMAQQPFGLGPRRCVGMRMAELVVKYTISRILLKFSVELSDKQKGTLDITGHGMASLPATGPWLVFRRLRNEDTTK